MGDSTKRRVTCAVCGRSGKVEVKKGGRIADRKWNFFGRFMLNAHANRELYQLVSSGESKGAMETGEIEDALHESRVTAEYWECEDCFRDLKKLGA